MIRVRPLTAADVAPIAAAARAADRAEIEEGCGQSIAAGLTLALRTSVAASVIEWDDTPLAAFGDVSYSPGAGIGIPWLISTEAIEQHPRAFLRICRPLVADMLERHLTLTNYVDARNTAAIRWLQWLGFEMESPAPYGPGGMLFRRFSMESGHD